MKAGMTHVAARTRDVARKLASVLTLIASFAGAPERAYAEEAHADVNGTAARSLLGPGRQSNGTSSNRPDWGWLVIGPSLVAGAACTGYGLSLDCASTDGACRRKASLAIWGGVGISSLGSLIGLALLESQGASRQGTATALDLQLELSRDSSSAGSLLPNGALLRWAGRLSF
jgi:hypothetical protein